jgi:arylsulfatase A-like enzyme
MIISAPSVKAGKTKTVTEFVDIFPTLCDLAGVPVPTNLDGKSLVSVMKNPASKTDGYAVSQYPRSLKKDVTEKIGYDERGLMGYSIRTERYRYTVWMNNNFRSNEAFTKDRIYTSELYDYEKDPLETVNVADDKAYASVYKDMNDRMTTFMATQANKN